MWLRKIIRQTSKEIRVFECAVCVEEESSIVGNLKENPGG